MGSRLEWKKYNKKFGKLKKKRQYKHLFKGQPKNRQAINPKTRRQDKYG
jgi:hypothetical protein